MTPNERNMKQSETGGSGGLSQTTVILMVVITIVLSSAIGAFVLQLGNTVSEPAEPCRNNGGIALDEPNTGTPYDYCYYENNSTMTDIGTGEVVIQGEPG